MDLCFRGDFFFKIKSANMRVNLRVGSVERKCGGKSPDTMTLLRVKALGLFVRERKHGSPPGSAAQQVGVSPAKFARAGAREQVLRSPVFDQLMNSSSKKRGDFLYLINYQQPHVIRIAFTQ